MESAQKEGNVCEGCDKKKPQDTPKLTYYTEHHTNLLLCDDCIAKIEKEHNLKCPKCGKVVGVEGMTEYKTEPMCYSCEEKELDKEDRAEKRISFAKKNWKIWIGITAGIIAALVFLAR